MKFFKKMSTFLGVFMAISLVINFATSKNVQAATHTYYAIVNLRTGLELHMPTDNDVCVWSTGDSLWNNSNRWYFVDTDSEYIAIVNARTQQSLHMAEDNDVVGWQYSGNSNQWTIQYRGSVDGKGVYTFTNRRTGLQLHNDENNDVVGWFTESDNLSQSNLWYLKEITISDV